MDTKLLMKFLWSLSLADHLGDVEEAIAEVWSRMEFQGNWRDMAEMRDELKKLGITGGLWKSEE